MVTFFSKGKIVTMAKVVKKLAKPKTTTAKTPLIMNYRQSKCSGTSIICLMEKQTDSFGDVLALMGGGGSRLARLLARFLSARSHLNAR